MIRRCTQSPSFHDFTLTWTPLPLADDFETRHFICRTVVIYSFASSVVLLPSSGSQLFKWKERGKRDPVTLFSLMKDENLVSFRLNSNFLRCQIFQAIITCFDCIMRDSYSLISGFTKSIAFLPGLSFHFSAFHKIKQLKRLNKKLVSSKYTRNKTTVPNPSNCIATQ